MTNIPKHLVKAIVTVLNNNTRRPIAQDALDMIHVRRLLIRAGCISYDGHYDCEVIDDGCDCSGCVDCGGHVEYRPDSGLCLDCRVHGPCAGCDGCAQEGVREYCEHRMN